MINFFPYGKRASLFFYLLLFFALNPFVGYGQLPPDFYDTPYLSGFDFPIGHTFDKNGRMYVWEKAGRVWVVDPTGNVFPSPLLDLTEEVANWQDHGLLGFALDPNFLSNGYFYLLYALDPYYYTHFGSPAYQADSSLLFQPTIGRVSRFTADPTRDQLTVLPGSKKVLLGEKMENGIPLYYGYHGLGSVIFGEDGTLLISAGDGSSNAGPDIGGDSLGTMASLALAAGIITPDQDRGSYRAQYLGNLNGKILRIDAETGDGLASNPFYDPANPRSPQSRIWSYGLRNPYRIVLRPGSGSHSPEAGQPGAIYIGDVGNGAWEELDVATKGGENFGWPILEGLLLNWRFFITEVPPNLMAPNPLFESGGCDQAYFNFRDLMTRPRPDGNPISTNPCNTQEPIPAEAFPSVETIPVLAYSNAAWNKPARAQAPIFDENNNIIPIQIDEEQSPIKGELFDGYSSLAGVFYTGDQFPAAYRGKYFGVDFSGWIRVFDFDENNQLHAVETFHDHTPEIIHLAQHPTDGSLYYLNLAGEIRKISYGGNPPPVAVLKANQTYGSGPLMVEFDASASYDPDSSALTYEWDFGDGQYSRRKKPQHLFYNNSNTPQSFTVNLTVTDAQGATGQVSEVISINNTPPEVNINSFQDGDLYPLTATSLLRLAADVSDKEQKQQELDYEWRIFFHHNDHFHPEPPIQQAQAQAIINPLGCGQESFWYRIELEVKDPAGLSTTDSKSIYPDCEPPFVRFVSLKATPEGRTIQLEWQTEQQQDVDFFEVQRSSDFQHFQLLGKIRGRSLSNVYQFLDKRPLIGTNIYRIKAISKRNAFNYSNLIIVNYPPMGSYSITPNPASDVVTLKIKTLKGNLVNFELFNAAGISSMTSQWEAIPGDPFEKAISTDRLNAGAYFYRISQGGETYSGKLVIKE